MVSDELLKLGILGIGTVVGYFLKHYLDQCKEAEVRRIADRRDHYRNLVLCLKALNEGRRDAVEALRHEYSFLWLYVPDSVVYSFNHLLRHLDSEVHTPKSTLEVGKLLVAVRRDLGFRDTQLLASDFESGAMGVGISGGAMAEEPDPTAGTTAG